MVGWLCVDVGVMVDVEEGTPVATEAVEVKPKRIRLSGKKRKRGRPKGTTKEFLALRKAFEAEHPPKVTKTSARAKRLADAVIADEARGWTTGVALGVKSPYVKTREWRMDMTPIREVLNEQGLALLDPKKHDLGICQLGYQDRAKVGLIREFDANLYRKGPGNPKGYVPIAAAYTVVATLPLPDVERLSRGETPESLLWPSDREVTMQYVRAAREHLSAGRRGTPGEINNRADGVLTHEIRSQTVSFVVEVPATLNLGDWQLQAAKEFGESDEL